MGLEPCHCGKKPAFSAMQCAEDAVLSQHVCQIGTPIPGGGSSLGGCGKEGPEVEDAYSDEGTSRDCWNAMIRAERRLATFHAGNPATAQVAGEGDGDGAL